VVDLMFVLGEGRPNLQEKKKWEKVIEFMGRNFGKQAPLQEVPWLFLVVVTLWITSGTDHVENSERGNSFYERESATHTVTCSWRKWSLRYFDR